MCERERAREREYGRESVCVREKERVCEREMTLYTATETEMIHPIST